MPLFKSLRSKSSSRKSVASIATNGNEKDNDFAPHSTSSTTFASVKSETNGGNIASSSPVKQSSLPRYTSSSSVGFAKGSSTTKDGTMIRSFSELASTVSKGDGSTDVAPRPSELFAGKGVQWGAVKLAGPNVTPNPVAGTNTTEDLQNFLKMRRQWKPTFATEDGNDKLGDFQPPKDLSQLSFASGDKVQSQGLMSLKELDESHKRKERLLSAAPLGGSLWDEAETSKAASARLAKVNPKASATANPKVATNYGKPKNLRSASHQSTSSNKSAKRFFGGGQKSSVPPPQPVPMRDSSAKIVKPSNEKDYTLSKSVSGAEGGALGMTGVAPPTTAADLNSAPVLAKETENGVAASKIETETQKAENSGLAEAGRVETTNGIHSDPVAEVDDADKTLTANDVEKMPLEKEEKDQVSADSTIPQSEEAVEEVTKPTLVEQAEAVEATTESAT